VAVVVSHPIQYYAPLYRRLGQSEQIAVTVLFAAKIGLEVRRDVKMGVDLAWNTDLTSGYAHRFLDGAQRIHATTFFGVDNPGVAKALSAVDPQVVMLHGYGAMTNLKALAWARLGGRPLALVSDSTTDASATPFRRALKHAIGPRLLNQFSAFLTLGDRAEAYLARYGAPRRHMFRVPAMIDEGFWRARAERSARRAACRAALGFSEGDVVLICVGKLYPGKRLHDVIAALEGGAIGLIVVGDGELREDLQRAAEIGLVNARFLGFVNIDVLPDVYAAADALVHAAELEQYGMVLVEGAVIGLPLIVSDRVGAIGETSIAQPGVNALVYPCGDVGALRAAIADLAGDPTRRADFAAASLQISEAHRGAQSLAEVEAACRFAAQPT
jgi:glycosyltransferase involved in cell wall biosynthesis